MKATNIRRIAGVLTLALIGSSASLHAQSPPPSANPYIPPDTGTPAFLPAGGYRSPLDGKLYVGFDAGVALQQDVTISDSIGDSEKVTFDPGVRLDWMLGYQFNEHWAAELELGFIANQVKHSYALGTDYYSVTYFQFPLLVNGIFTLPLNRSESCSVYFGAGLGGVFSQYVDEYGDETPSESTFAYQGLAGFRWAINPRWELGLGYKFLGTTGHDIGGGWDSNGNPTEFKSDGTVTHSILATVTYRF
jgi:opacity protein-like surface antigen